MCEPCPPMCCPEICCEPCPPICEPICDPQPNCDPCYQPNPCNPCPPKRCKSRELRSSILMTQCDCVKRNGLQYDCPRRGCSGRPCCITKPIPLCCPSRYMWRYANVAMGKPTTIRCPKPAFKPVVKNCNPCVVNPCDEFSNDCC